MVSYLTFAQPVLSDITRVGERERDREREREREKREREREREKERKAEVLRKSTP